MVDISNISGAVPPRLEPRSESNSVKASTATDAPQQKPVESAKTTSVRENSDVNALSAGKDPLELAAKAIEELVPNDLGTSRLRINKDDETGHFIYQSIDKESGEVISQFPIESIFELISHYREPEGLIVDNKA